MNDKKNTVRDTGSAERFTAVERIRPTNLDLYRTDSKFTVHANIYGFFSLKILTCDNRSALRYHLPISIYVLLVLVPVPIAFVAVNRDLAA